MIKRSFLLLVICLASLVIARPAWAVSVPNFPSCPNPGGTLSASYSSGTHGVPGDQNTYTGSDSVYTINSEQLVQCFCAATNISGIQTNWWKASSLTQEQINLLVSQGWIYVPDGSAWGLSPVPYLAQNSANACGTSGNGGGEGGGGGGGPSPAPACTAAKPPTPTLLSVTRQGTKAILAWIPVNPATYYTIAYGTTPGNYPFGVPNTGNVTSYAVGSLDPNATYYFAVRAVNDCTPGDFATQSFGGGQVLGLATTGSAQIIALLLAAGFVSTILALVVKRLHRD